MEKILEVFGIDWKLLIAQGVNFTILLVGLSYLLYKPVLKILNEREKKIADGVKAAEVAEKAAKDNQAERDAIVTSAHKDADTIVARATEEAKKEKNSLLKTAQERAEVVVSDARLEAEELKLRSAKESEKEVARIATLAAEKILREQS